MSASYSWVEFSVAHSMRLETASRDDADVGANIYYSWQRRIIVTSALIIIILGSSYLGVSSQALGKM